jgi:hypothetical protein
MFCSTTNIQHYIANSQNRALAFALPEEQATQETQATEDRGPHGGYGRDHGRGGWDRGRDWGRHDWDRGYGYGRNW